MYMYVVGYTLYNRNSISEVIMLAIVYYGLNILWFECRYLNITLKHHACRFITFC